MRFIRVTSASSAMPGKNQAFAYINVDSIEAVYSSNEGTTLGLKSHNNGGYRCRETAEEVMRLIRRDMEVQP